jgi:hypothetical protein
MGDNAVTSVPVYQAADVLTAANLNITNSGIPVFSGTATRDSAFGGSGEKTLAEGQFAFLEDSNSTQFYDGSSWQAVGVAPGMVLIKSQTIGSAVSSVTVSDVFSATYDNYLINVDGGVATTDVALRITFGATSSGYRFTSWYTGWGTNTVTAAGGATQSSWDQVVQGTTSTLNGQMRIFDPFLAKQTVGHWNAVRTNASGENIMGWGVLNDSTSYTAFTLTISSGNMTGGTIRVYGFANS